MDYKSFFYDDFPITSKHLIGDYIMITQEVSFVGYSCDEYIEHVEFTVYVSVNVRTLEFQRITNAQQWALIYEYFQNCSLKDVPMKIWVWNHWKQNTPYEELSAKLQMRRDKFNNCYPNPDSKYFKDLSKEEIDETLLELQVELGDNLNDWKMYRDAVPDRYVNLMQNRISKIQRSLKKEDIYD